MERRPIKTRYKNGASMLKKEEVYGESNSSLLLSRRPRDEGFYLIYG
jgi:hypothetical protein